jgi:hypothetical protein
MLRAYEPLPWLHRLPSEVNEQIHTWRHQIRVTTIGILCMHVIEILFFTGLAGCASVVIFSWISIFKSGFSAKDDVKVFDEMGSGQTP